MFNTSSVSRTVNETLAQIILNMSIMIPTCKYQSNADLPCVKFDGDCISYSQRISYAEEQNNIDNETMFTEGHPTTHFPKSG